TGSTAAQAGFNGPTAVAPISCTPTASMMTFVTKVTNQSPHEYAHLVISTFGVVSHIPMVTQQGDCMCFAAASCTAVTAVCTIGGQNTPLDLQNDHCLPQGVSGVDENAIWIEKFGSRS